MNGNLKDKKNSYLWHRYVPRRDVPDWLWQSLVKPSPSERYDQKRAAAQLDRLFDRLCSENSGPHLVPLSGGWDSRLILCALRERLQSSEIETITFGCSGQWDLEIAKNVSRSLEVRHHVLNLDEVPIDWVTLLDSVKATPWSPEPDGYYNHMAREYAGEVCAASVWVGFLGETLTGGHLSKLAPDTSQDEWRTAFAKSQGRGKDQGLSEPGYYPDYGSIPETRDGPFELTEWLDFGFRQRCGIAPIVLGRPEWSSWSDHQGLTSTGAKIIAPFCDPIWAGYWLNAPRKFHRGQKLYVEMAKYKYKKTFTLPSKYEPARSILIGKFMKLSNRVNRRLQNMTPFFPFHPNQNLNYLDFDKAFRRRKDYKELLQYSIDYLKDKQVVPWLDIDSIAMKHMKFKKNCSVELLILIGLAANLYVERNFDM